jgi:hypothetical protein
MEAQILRRCAPQDDTSGAPRHRTPNVILSEAKDLLFLKSPSISSLVPTLRTTSPSAAEVLSAP